MSATLKPRYSHSLTAFSLGPGLTEVTVFGGTAEPYSGSDETQPKLADTTLLQFSELLNVYACTVTLYDITEQLGIHRADEGQPAWNSCMPFAWFVLYTLYLYIHMYNVFFAHIAS